MGIGHFAMGLALKKAEPRLSLGPLIFSAFLCDFLLGIFVWLGLERYEVPPDVAAKHYLTFTFPYSHGLMATLLWSLLAAGIAYITTKPADIRGRAAWILAVAVLSHFVLDALVHVAGLPVLGSGSPKIGLGLWNHLPLELSLEALMTVSGLIIYLGCTRGTTFGGRYGMALLLTVLTPVMIAGQATMTSAPPQNGLVASWLLSPLALTGFAWWLDRKRLPA